ncbi:MAG: tRNA epoxyqueuosine(34) reductase QueG [Gemmatimonadota bacterium]
MTASLSSRIKAEARQLGFELVGVAPLRASEHAAFYRRWLEQGHHGSMDYLAREDAVDARLDPTSRWPELRSAVVVGHFYDGTIPSSPRLPVSLSPSEKKAEGHPEHRPGATSPAYADFARYAKGRDYHRVVKKRLLALLHWLENETGEALPAARAYVDAGPVLERELARRAGLGWFGRNTMLIHPRKGSYFLLGELLLPLELEYDEPFEADRCGSCRACLDACPTGALLGRDADGAPVMNANLCISYLTIEHRGPIPEELRPAMGNHVFGCDVCQEVCPFNNPRFASGEVDREYRVRPEQPNSSSNSSSNSKIGGVGSRRSPLLPGTEAPSLVSLMRMTREEWDRWTRGSAIRRAAYAAFKRNVAVVMGNWLASMEEPPEAAVAVLREAVNEEEPLVREHAAWALERSGW